MPTLFEVDDLLSPDEFKKQGTDSSRINFAWKIFKDPQNIYQDLHKNAAIQYLKDLYKTDSIDKIAQKINIKKHFLAGKAYDVVEAFKQLNNQALNYFPEYGPLAKSTYSFQYENLFRQLMTGNPFKTELGPNGQMIIFENDNTFNLTEIITHANLSHLDFNQRDFGFYEHYCQNTSLIKAEVVDGEGESIYPSHTFFQHADKTGLFKDMTYAEKLAINIYTTHYYNELNPFLRGVYNYENKTPEEIRDVIIHAAMLGRALSSSNNSAIDATFRYEGIYDESILHKRIDISENGGAEIIRGFISTGKQPAKNFKNVVGIAYTNLQGKYIAPLSRFSTEREFLIPPTQMTYHGHTQEGNIHYFHARPVIDLSLIQEQAKNVATINDVIISKLNELETNLHTMRALIQDNSNEEDYEGYKEQLDSIDAWQDQALNLALKDADSTPKTKIVERLTETSDKLSTLAQSICLGFLNRFEDYKLGHNDEEVDELINKNKTQISQLTNWTDIKTLKQSLKQDLRSIKDKINTQDQAQHLNLIQEDIKQFLQDIAQYQFGKNDIQMNQYISEIKQRELDAENNIEDLSLIRAELKNMLHTLQHDPQSQEIKAIIQSLKNKHGFGTQNKANKIESAMCNVPLNERANILLGTSTQTKAVLEAMAAHRHTFKNNLVYKKDGKLDEKNAADTYKNFKKIISEQRNPNEPDAQNADPKL